MTLYVPLIPPQFLAFTVPLGAAGAARATGQGGRAAGNLTESHWRQIATLGLSMAMEYSDNKLADIKQRQIDEWFAQLRRGSVPRLLVALDRRLDDRHPRPGTSQLRNKLGQIEKSYQEISTDLDRAVDLKAKRLLRKQLEVTEKDLLRLVYEAHADSLFSTGSKTQPQAPTPQSRAERTPSGSAEPPTERTPPQAAPLRVGRLRRIFGRREGILQVPPSSQLVKPLMVPRPRPPVE